MGAFSHVILAGSREGGFGMGSVSCVSTCSNLSLPSASEEGLFERSERLLGADGGLDMDGEK